MRKINKLIEGWTRGTVMLTSQLNGLGYSNELLNKYVKSFWIESLGYGAYKLNNDIVDWYGAISTMQKECPIHPGGKTALELSGYAHYLKVRNSKVELFSNSNINLPGWFVNGNWSSRVEQVKTNLFEYNEKNKLLVLHSEKNVALKISSPELAIFEMLYRVPNIHSFEESLLIMESLTSLRHGAVQELLEKCNSIKVKRLFCYLAERHNHSWYKKLDLTKINFGSGKRVIVKGGKLDKKFNITVLLENEQ